MDSLQPILLLLIPRRQAKRLVRILQVAEGHGLARIPRSERRTAQSLTEDLVSKAEAFGVIVLGEDPTLDLQHRFVSN